jgi:23S rRNA (pseudouridine1915-N3)-methyltransferase
MKITLLCIGKTSDRYLSEGIEKYNKRLVRYSNFKIVEHSLPAKFNRLPPAVLMQKEAEVIVEHIEKNEITVLLDEKGRSFSSVEFADFISQKLNQSTKSILFVIGGAWGFAPVVYQKATEKLSLSKMTFSHQMVRLFFVEQLYRAFSILKNEPYHND